VLAVASIAATVRNCWWRSFRWNPFTRFRPIRTWRTLWVV